MDYISTKEAAEKWGVSLRIAQRYIADGRIPGAKKYGAAWFVPADAEKPLDPRKEKKQKTAPCQYLYFGSYDMPKVCPEIVIDRLEEPFLSLIRCHMAYLHCDYEAVKQYWYRTADNSEIKLNVAAIAIAAAVSSADNALFHKIQAFLERCAKSAQNEREKRIASLPWALAMGSMCAPSMAPEWLKNGDFEGFSEDLRPFLLYLYIQYLRDTGRHEAACSFAKSGLMLCSRTKTFTYLDVYFNLICAVEHWILHDTDAMQGYLKTALELCLPNGFLAPIAEYTMTLWGIMDELLERDYPDEHAHVMELAKCSFANWMTFHNQFTKEHVTTILTPQEYHAAQLLAGGATYAEAACSMKLSVGRFKNIISAVYDKLNVNGRRELSTYIN